MSKQPTLTEVLNRIESSKEPVSELDIGTSLRQLVPKKAKNLPVDLRSEVLAFDFNETGKNKDDHWGTFFGPTWRQFDEEKKEVVAEVPTMESILPETISYWERRSKEANHPVLVSRYAGLVWEFSPKIVGKKAPFDIALRYLESLIETAEQRIHKYSGVTQSKLERALRMAHSFRQEELRNRALTAMWDYEKEVGEDDKPGLWGNTFELMMSMPKEIFGGEMEKEIIADLEERLERFSNQDKPRPDTVEYAAELLAKYYRKKGQEEEVVRVLDVYEQSVSKILESEGGMRASFEIEKLMKTYSTFGFNEKKEEWLIRLRDKGGETMDELKSISHSYEFPKAELDKVVEQIISHPQDQWLDGILMHYLPLKEENELQTRELAKQFPTMHLFTTRIYDEKGRAVASLGSLEDDFEGHVARNIAQNMQFGAPFLAYILREVFKHHANPVEGSMAYIKQNIAIESSHEPIFQAGFEAYFKENYMAAVHLLIPQIEEVVRNVLESAGGNVLKPARSGGYHLRTFDDVLRDPIVRAIFSEDLAFYYRVLFTDQKGWNLRNSICHGMLPAAAFNQKTADRVYHAAISLGLLRPISED